MPNGDSPVDAVSKGNRGMAGGLAHSDMARITSQNGHGKHDEYQVRRRHVPYSKPDSTKPVNAEVL